VASYCIHFNAARAAREIGTPAHRAGSVGIQLRDRPHVARRLRELRDARAQEAREMSERIVDEMAAIAFSSCGSFIRVDTNGQFQLDLSRVSSRDLAGLEFLRVHIQNGGAGLDQGVKVSSQVRMCDKLRAMKWFLRYFSAPKRRTSHRYLPATHAH